MNKQLLLLILAICPSVVWAKITPEVNIPDNFGEAQPVLDRLEEQYGDYNSITNSGCGDVTFKDFTPKSYSTRKYEKNNSVYKGITLLYCDFENTEKNDGYGPGRFLPEKVYFDKKGGVWKKKKYHLSKEETKESLRYYGISDVNDLQPVVLYNIESVNAKGYAVIDSNILKEDKANGVKGKTISFCLMHNGDALCGYGPMVYTFDGKDIDFSPYVLKSLETIEMGLPANL